jgi:hypothetical protein
MKALQHRNSSVRRVAAVAIGRTLLPQDALSQALPALADLLLDPDPKVRLAAVATLEKMEASAKLAVPKLILAALDATVDPPPPQQPSFRCRVVHLLGKIGREAAPAGPALERLLEVRNRELRVQAAIALWRVEGNTNVIPMLTAELDQNSLAMSLEVLAALREMGPAAKSVASTLMKQAQLPPYSGPAMADPMVLALEAIDPVSASNANKHVSPSLFGAPRPSIANTPWSSRPGAHALPRHRL